MTEQPQENKPVEIQNEVQKPTEQPKKLSPMERRKRSMQTSAQSRLDLIMGKTDEIKEDEPPKQEVKETQNQTEQPESQMSQFGKKMEESGITRKMGMISIAFYVLSIGILIGHFMGYTLFGSEFFGGFACCFSFVIGFVLMIIKRLIVGLPKISNFINQMKTD